jgi:hypothetical protein
MRRDEGQCRLMEQEKTTFESLWEAQKMKEENLRIS